MKAIDGTKETFYQLSPSEWMMLCSRTNLTFAAVKILMYLKTLNPWGDRKLEAKTKDLAEALNLNPRTVHRALHELANKAFIDLEITRFKFSLTSNVAVCTPQEGLDVAVCTPQEGLDVAVCTPQEGLDVANSRRTDRLKGVQTAQTVCTPRTPSESLDTQGFQEPSYYSYSSDLKKDSLSPKGSLSEPNQEREREGSLALKEQELEVCKNGFGAIATPLDEPDTKFNLVKKPQTVEGRSSASPPEIFQINTWADFIAPGADEGFWASVLKKVANLPAQAASPECVAESWIKKQGHALWTKYLETQKQQVQRLNLLPPVPEPQDISEELASLEVCLSMLNWNRQQAIDHMVEHYNWPRRAEETLRGGKIFNWRVVNDPEILQLTEALEDLCAQKTYLKTP
jgi:hypothetical protein